VGKEPRMSARHDCSPGMVGVRGDPGGVGGGAVVDRPRVVQPPAPRTHAVAGPGRLLGRGSSERPILGGLIARAVPATPTGGLARLRVGPGPPAAGRILRRLRLGGGPRIAARPPHDLPTAGPGRTLALAFAPFLFLLFPTGSLPSRRWRPIAWDRGRLGGCAFALALLFDNPDTVGGAITAMAVAVATRQSSPLSSSRRSRF
jgi:hypothetical protein